MTRRRPGPPHRRHRRPGGRIGRVLLSLLAAGLLLGSVPAGAPAQETRVLLVVGLGGGPEYRETFHGWATGMRDALTRLGVPRDHIVYVGERPDEHPGEMDGEASREGLEEAVNRVAAAAGPRDRVLVVLIGHGTSRGDEVRFNLPGPDISPAEVAALLDGAFPTQTVAVVNTTEASGPFVEAVSGPGRVVLTATRSAQERNETRFGEFFAAALEGDGADLDKDGRLSLLEIFQYAAREVQRHYEEQNLLLTEHAVLDDNGDGEGTSELGPDAADGSLARTFVVGSLSPAVTAAAGAAGVPDSITDPALRRLYEERAAIQTRIDELRLRKDRMEQEAYESQLEDLLVELALKNREIQERGGGG